MFHLNYTTQAYILNNSFEQWQFVFIYDILLFDYNVVSLI